MQIKYVGDCGGNDVATEEKCRQCEMSHLTDIEKLKYDIKYNQHKDLCDFCDHSFYVYGIERDCKNYYKCLNRNFANFSPVIPFHDKSISGA